MAETIQDGKYQIQDGGSQIQDDGNHVVKKKNA